MEIRFQSEEIWTNGPVLNVQLNPFCFFFLSLVTNNLVHYRHLPEPRETQLPTRSSEHLIMFAGCLPEYQDGCLKDFFVN
ncbi:hypothetical protein ILYODFUR_036185 [Ilyodon furcidens]|uniref:Uncharacterized protein n=1 Tax=Ilyodon furcidens TaxID=33524 RepID=A0ABV0VJZ5_9TELE